MRNALVMSVEHPLQGEVLDFTRTEWVTLISEMDLFLRNGRNGDFFYEMELQNPNLMSNISLSCFNTRVRQ